MAHDEFIGMAFYSIPGKQPIDIRRVRLLDNPEQFIDNLHSQLGRSIAEGMRDKIQNFIEEGSVTPVLNASTIRRWRKDGNVRPLFETGAFANSMKVIQLTPHIFMVGHTAGEMHPPTHAPSGTGNRTSTKGWQPISMGQLAALNIKGSGSIPSRPFILEAIDERDIQDAYARNMYHNLDQAFKKGLKGIVHTVAILKKGFK